MTRCLLPLLFLSLCLLCQPAPAVDLVDMAAGSVSGEGWSAGELQLNVNLNRDNSLALDLRSSWLRLATDDRRIEDVHWHCPRLEQVGAELTCEQSLLDIGQSPWGAARFTLGWQFSDLGNWHVSLHKAQTDAGALQAELSMHQGKWRGKISSQQLRLGRLLQLLPPAIRAGWSLSGNVSLAADFKGSGAEMQALSLSLQGQQIAYSDADGLQAGENVALKLDLDANLSNGHWAGSLDVSVEQGQLYSNPVYLAVIDNPLSFNARFDGQAEHNRLHLDQASVTLPGVVTANFTAAMEQWQWNDVEVQFQAPDLSGFYRVLAQPFLIGTAMDELSLQGSGAGSLKWNNNDLMAFDIDLHKVDVEDEQGRFGIRQLNTELHWSNQGEAAPSLLSVAGGHLFRIGFGQVEANMLVVNGRLLIREKVSMPLLGGQLSLNNLTLDGLSRPPVNWQLAMTANQIQLDALSRALDWPLLSGRLDGHIPSVQYTDGKVLLDGELIVDVFGGRVIVQDLQILDPMDVAPVLETQLRLRDLDLAQVTSTFSFGRIEGLLEGEIDELQLVGWELNRFRAGIRTPEQDKSSHRISQRAIDNLTSLGTGVSAGLSGTALRVFKDFAYDRIALEVDLAGDKASLDGIAYKDGGYYIVKGAGLPRIDVIGHTREIAWKDLVSRIQDARFDEVVIE